MASACFPQLAAMRILVFVALLITAQANAQLDSLLRLRDALPQDTSRLGVLTELLRATVFNDPDSALVFAAEYRLSLIHI